MVGLLDRYYHVAEEVIAESGGRMIKFMGDSVLAVFESADARRAATTLVRCR